MSRVFVLFIDALRYDFITSVDTPYLYSLSVEGGRLRLRSILGYSDAIRATIFTGTYPDRHGYWIMYRFCPETSPYKVYEGLRFLDGLPGLLGRGSKFLASKFVGLPMAWSKGYSDMETRNIPFHVVRFFDKTLHREILEEGALPVPTIFDVLRERGVRFEYIDSSRGNPVKAVDRIGMDTELTMIYLHYLDFAAHRYGLEDSRYMEVLRRVNRLSRYLVRKVEEKMGGSVDLLVFSDHGMTRPRHYIDLSRLVDNPQHGREYLLFLDSTMIHIWYLNSEKKDEIRAVLGRSPYGRILSWEDREKLRVCFSHRWYGDDVYLLEPDYQIFPNYISLLKPKGMHAYHPEYEHQNGVFISRVGVAEERVVEIPDVTATIYRLMGLKPPPICEGKSVV